MPCPMQPCVAKNVHRAPKGTQGRRGRAGLASWFYPQGRRGSEQGTWDGMPRLRFSPQPSPQHTASRGDSSLRKDFVLAVNILNLAEPFIQATNSRQDKTVPYSPCCPSCLPPFLPACLPPSSFPFIFPFVLCFICLFMHLRIHRQNL